MHAGARVVRLKYGEGEWAFSVLAEFTEHQSMNYGSDVQPLEGEGGKRRTVVSTSFYDKLMCVWEFGEGE
jgi:diphthamide biosynthesis protein 7